MFGAAPQNIAKYPQYLQSEVFVRSKHCSYFNTAVKYFSVITLHSSVLVWFSVSSYVSLWPKHSLCCCQFFSFHSNFYCDCAFTNLCLYSNCTDQPHCHLNLLNFLWYTTVTWRNFFLIKCSFSYLFHSFTSFSKLIWKLGFSSPSSTHLTYLLFLQVIWYITL